MSQQSETSSHLVDDRSFFWDWSGEDPVEIIVVIFILVLFFTLPRGNCGVEKTHDNFETSGQAAAEETADRAER